MRLPAGQQLGGFEILQQIGRGAMGTVYRARQLALEREVALKVLDAHDAEAFTRFREEAIRVGQLSHPNILPVYDFGHEDDLAYIAMALAAGGTLATQIGLPMPVEHIVRLLAPAAQALDYAHGVNVIHRDIKPANLLFDAQGRIYLADFGLALLRDGTTASWGHMLGTPSHMAPEQFRGKAEPASDIYALAVTVFQLLTGRLPYERENPLATALAHLKEDIPSAREFNPDVSPEVARVVRRGMAKNPASRYERAVDLIAALKMAQRAASGEVVPVRAIRAAAAMPDTRSAAAGDAFVESTSLPSAGRAPELGRTLFESKSTLEWARASIVVRGGKVSMRDDVVEVSLPAGSQAQVLLPAGTLQDTWAALEFSVTANSGIFDVLFHEGVTPQSHCLRVDPRQGIVSVGLMRTGDVDDGHWLGARRVVLAPGTDHTVLVVTAGECIDAFLDGEGLLSVQDGTVTQGIARLRMLPAAGSASTLRLKRVAVYRPPE
ncbi:MAG TPA: serine/threonine-protein kinase [Chloroflexota bacterium]|nr:serine/threonine-protein kinase [Chloroflexota bacterium]